jgi:hypothetical protein
LTSLITGDDRRRPRHTHNCATLQPPEYLLRLSFPEVGISLTVLTECARTHLGIDRHTFIST